MLNFVLRRVFSGVMALVVVASLTFFLLSVTSGSVARNVLGETATAAQIAQKEADLGLDQPILTRFLNWIGGALRGDFGTSWFTNQPVTESITTRLPVTMSMIIVSIALTAGLAVVFGMLAAVRRGWVDRCLQVLAIFASAIPQFVLAIVIVSVFAIWLSFFPATGYTPASASVSGWALAIALPVLALAVNGFASAAQQVRSATITVLGKDFVRTLRSRGLSEREILLKHVLREAAPAALTIIALQFIGLLSGVVVIEQIFALPGVGFLALNSSLQGDMPVLMGVVVVTVVMVIAVNLLADLAVGWLNPKARVA